MAFRNRGGARYVLAFLALLVLTAGSLGLSFVPLGAFGVPVALSIAFVKATIVGLFFMHLREARLSTQMVAVLNLLFVALICLGIVADVAFR